MRSRPRFQAELFICQNTDEMEAYSDAFHKKIARAFDDVEDEASCVEKEEYLRLGESGELPLDDPASGVYLAHQRALEFYLARRSVQAGVLNLMVARLFHLFEQQASSLARFVLPKPRTPANSENGVDQMGHALADQGVDQTSFTNWGHVHQLRLIANVVKHGDGKSAKELKQRNPKLFEETSTMRPLVGEGLKLTEGDFTSYYAAAQGFWEELIAAPLPVLCS